MADRKHTVRTHCLANLEKKIRNLLAHRNAKGDSNKAINEENKRIQDEYSEKYKSSKSKLITRRILKSKECYSKLITKGNMPLFDFSLLSPSRLMIRPPSVEEIKSNPFKHSPQRSVSFKSRPSAAFEDLSYSAWQQQSPCFGKRPDGSEIEYEDVDDISMRAFKPLDNVAVAVNKNRRISVDTDHKRSKSRPSVGVKQ
jgi:hypothetical protein